MTKEESVSLSYLNDKFDKFLQSDMAYKEIMSKEMASVKRGLYGDEENHVKGVIQQLRDNAEMDNQIKKRVTDLEDFKKESIKWGLGAMAGFSFAMNLIIYFFKNFTGSK